MFLFLRKAAAYIVGGFFLLFSIIAIGSHIAFKLQESDIYALMDRSAPGNKNPPALLRQLVKISHSKGTSLESVVARKVLDGLQGENTERAIFWKVKYFIFSTLVKIEIPDEDIYGFYLALSFNGVNYGAEELSQRLFAKNLSSLSEEESAEIAVILWSPSQYEDATVIKRRRDELVARFREGN